MAYHINHANIKDWAKNYDGEPFDAILCDPPYELGFMGKSWDSSGIAFDSDMWADILKLLKPGGHLLAFSGSRTYHRMAVAIEDAGFEIRDMIEWVYGSGFPKSLNIGKQLDKTPNLEMHPQSAKELKEAMKLKGYTNTFDVAEKVVGRRTGAVANWQKYQWPEAKWWPKLKEVLGMDDKWGDILAEIERELIGSKTTNKTVYQKIGQDNESGSIDITKGTSPYEGYGTALKPAHEPCVLARKPLDKGMTVAGNVLKHGTGGLNIDGTRVEGKFESGWSKAPGKKSVGGILNITDESREAKPDNPQGRFPANLIHDGSDEVEAVFPDTKGSKTSPRSNNAKSWKNTSTAGIDHIGHNDSGSASRFFYTAKASKSERNAGLEGFEEQDSTKQFNQGMEGQIRSDGTVIKPPIKQTNHHPTVKPLSLTKYLATLIKPPTGGRLLVPFSGSGSEMIGALQAGWEYVEGVELTEEYIPIAEARIKHWLDKMSKEQLEML